MYPVKMDSFDSILRDLDDALSSSENASESGELSDISDASDDVVVPETPRRQDKIKLLYRDYVGNRIFASEDEDTELHVFRNGFQTIVHVKGLEKTIQQITFPDGKEVFVGHLDARAVYFIPTKKMDQRSYVDSTVILLILSRDGNVCQIRLGPSQYISVYDDLKFREMVMTDIIERFQMSFLNADGETPVSRKSVPIKSVSRNSVSGITKLTLRNGSQLSFSGGVPLLFSLANKEIWFFNSTGMLDHIIYADKEEVFFWGDNLINTVYIPEGEDTWTIRAYDASGKMNLEESGYRGHRHLMQDMFTY